MESKSQYLAASTGLLVSGARSKGMPANEGGGNVILLEDDLCGYADSLRTLPGDKVPLAVHSQAAGSAQLCRHGEEKVPFGEPVAFDRCVQDLPDGDFTQTGPRWKMIATVTVPGEARPGLYSIGLQNENGERFSIPLVVESPQRKERVLVLASTNTWCAYNIWGGRSRYRDHLAKPMAHGFRRNLRQAARIALRQRPWLLSISRKIGTTRTAAVSSSEAGEGTNYSGEPLSMRRPFPKSGLDDRSAHDRYCNHLAGGEWRALAWLEKQGIDYDYCSDLEMERHPERFADYDAVIISTHSEYWSKSAYQGLLVANLSGTAVISLSGNTIYRQCVSDEDSGTVHFIGDMFCQTAVDEGELLGVRFTNVDVSTAAPYEACPALVEHFPGLDIDAGDLLGSDTLFTAGAHFFGSYQPELPSSPLGLAGSGASGWETDKVCSDDENFVVIAKGKNPNGGADMVFRAAKAERGLVFCASSMTFTASLLVDRGCSDLVVAVIERALAEIGSEAEEERVP